MEVILAISRGLGGDLRKNGGSVKTNDSTTFWLHFGVLGGRLEPLGEYFVWSSWELLLRSGLDACQHGAKLLQDLGARKYELYYFHPERFFCEQTH